MTCDCGVCAGPFRLQPQVTRPLRQRPHNGVLCTWVGSRPYTGPHLVRTHPRRWGGWVRYETSASTTARLTAMVLARRSSSRCPCAGLISWQGASTWPATPSPGRDRFGRLPRPAPVPSPPGTTVTWGPDTADRQQNSLVRDLPHLTTSDERVPVAQAWHSSSANDASCRQRMTSIHAQIRPPRFPHARPEATPKAGCRQFESARGHTTIDHE